MLAKILSSTEAEAQGDEEKDDLRDDVGAARRWVGDLSCARTTLVAILRALWSTWRGHCVKASVVAVPQLLVTICQVILWLSEMVPGTKRTSPDLALGVPAGDPLPSDARATSRP